MSNTAGEAVLVTGGSRGIGAATARLAGARGWPVAVNYRNDAAAADTVVAAIRAAGGRGASVGGDVSDPAACAALFDAAEAAVGPIGRVVINAGIIGERMPLAEMAPDRIARIIEVNLTGALYTAREAARRLPAGGSIVIVSSAAARLGSGGEFVDYAASKGGTDTLTLGLARELGPKGVRVNGVRPGLIETEIHAAAGWPERAQVMGEQVPLKRAGTAEEVGEAVVWLLSDAASYVSAALLDVTGGR